MSALKHNFKEGTHHAECIRNRSQDRGNVRLFNHHFYTDELTRPAITVSPDGGRGAYGWCSIHEIWQKGGEEACREI
ncbi:MAG: hypothetical protein RR224_13025, partial [Clostridia bacterium]